MAAKQSGYLKKKQAEVDTYRQAEKDTYIQFMTDMLVLTLNDPDVMGKDVFGENRIETVVKAWGQYFDKFHGALESVPEADYLQDTLDFRLKKIVPHLFAPFPDRYPWIKEIVYKRRR